MTELTIFEKFLYSTCSIGAGLFLLAFLCALAWMRDAANDWRKDIP